VVAVWAWKVVNLRSEHIIHGKLEDLRGSDVVTTDQSDLYLSRTYLPGGRIDYKWRLVSTAPLPAGTRIPVFFQRIVTREGGTEPEVVVYELEVHPEFYDRTVIMRYDRAAERMLLILDGRQVPLPVQSNAPGEPAPAGAAPQAMLSLVMRTALAADKPDLRNLPERLEAYDPIVRLKAQKALRESGAEGVSESAALLSAERMPGREVLIAALEALNGVERIPAGALDEGALDTVAAALTHSDRDVRAAARRFVAKHRSPELAARIDARMVRLREAGGLRAAVELETLASVQLDLLYNLGIDEKDRYGGRRPEDRELIDVALARFDRAWSLRELVPTDARAPFAKALWGRALARHDRSWIERRSDGSRDPELVAAAVEGFEDFVGAVERLGAARYPYPQHLLAARAYVANPEPDSLLGRWFVVAGSFWKSQRDQAERVAARLAEAGLGAQVTDTDGYPNLRDGLWAVTLGPYREEQAQAVQARVRKIVPDAYVKAGW
jgi:hypothetical protein